MSIRHDMICVKCDAIDRDVVFSGEPDSIHTCGEKMEILWSYRRHVPSVHEKERAVVWENSATGEVRYPDRNDRPIPQRYKDQGFARRELTNLHEVHQFEKQHNVLSETAWFDKGSGRGHDSEQRRPKLR